MFLQPDKIAAVRVFGFWKNSFSGSMTSIFPRFIQLTVSQRRYTSSRLCDTKMTGFPASFRCLYISCSNCHFR